MPREYARLRQYVVFYLQNFKVFVLRILKNSVGKVDHFEFVLIILALFQNCDTVDLDSHHGFYFLFPFLQKKIAIR